MFRMTGSVRPSCCRGSLVCHKERSSHARMVHARIIIRYLSLNSAYTHDISCFSLLSGVHVNDTLNTSCAATATLHPRQTAAVGACSSSSVFCVPVAALRKHRWRLLLALRPCVTRPQ